MKNSEIKKVDVTQKVAQGSSDVPPPDACSAKQCSECKKDCILKNRKGLCLTDDPIGRWN